jgi:hypothetical protein
MPACCSILGCKLMVPVALESEKVCILHFLLAVEESCSGMRRETAMGRTPHERQLQIMNYIAERGELLARVSTGGLHLGDDMKARVLNAFLTLMNLRENLDRAALRQPIARERR